MTERSRSIRLPLAWPIFALALALTACTTSIENWEDVRPAKQPEVQSIDYHHTVEFAGRSTKVSTREVGRLEQFLAEIGADPANHVAISPREDGSADATRSRTAEARAHAISRVLRRRGFDPTIVSTGTTAPGEPAHVDVVVRQFLVSLPPCPDWTDRPGWNFGNKTSSNFGCATATNFGLMVADPADLLRGAGPQPASAEPLALSIDRYRHDKIKELKIESTTTAFPDAGGGDN